MVLLGCGRVDDDDGYDVHECIFCMISDIS